MIDVEAFHDELERTGEEEVRRNLAARTWGMEHHAVAEVWIQARDQSRSEASQAAQIEIARSAKDAAWEAARAANKANTLARIALAIATIGAIISAASIVIAYHASSLT